MSGEYVSTEFNCWRISVIVHRSANDKLAVDSLVLLVCGLTLIPPGKFFPIKDLWTRVWQTLQVFVYTQLYAPYDFICAYRESFGPWLSKQLLHRMPLITRNAKSIEVWLYTKCQKINLSGSIGDFPSYVIRILTNSISYLWAWTIETSSLPNDSMRPLIKRSRFFLAYWLYISTLRTFLYIRASY